MKFKSVSSAFFAVIGVIIPLLLAGFAIFLKNYTKSLDKIEILKDIKEHANEDIIYSASVLFACSLIGFYINLHIENMIFSNNNKT